MSHSGWHIYYKGVKILENNKAKSLYNMLHRRIDRFKDSLLGKQ